MLKNENLVHTIIEITKLYTFVHLSVQNGKTVIYMIKIKTFLFSCISFKKLPDFFFNQVEELSSENRTLKEDLNRSKRENAELKAKKEQEIAQLKERLAALEVIII